MITLFANATKPALLIEGSLTCVWSAPAHLGYESQDMKAGATRTGKRTLDPQPT